MRSRRNKKPPAETTITDLPQAVLLHIISFLPIRAAIRISAVARTLNNLWLSLPTLKLDMYPFMGRNLLKTTRECRLLFAEFVDQVLRHRCRCPLPVQKFQLRFFYRNYDHIRAYVDSWVRRLVYLEVVELDLDFGYRGLTLDEETDDGEEGWEDEILSEPYEFHFSKIVSSSIQNMKFRNITLVFPPKELPLKINSIKKIHWGEFSGSADEIKQLMDACINIETFVLEFKGNYPDLSIVSKNLKHLRVVGSTQAAVHLNSLEICTPKLETIEFDQYCSGMYTLNDASSLVEATIDFNAGGLWEFACWTLVVSSLTGVKRLTIDNVFMVSEFPKTYEDVRKRIEEQYSRDPYYTSNSVEKFKFEEKVFSETFEFHNLKYLKLRTGYFEEHILGLEFILKKCPLLETIVLDASSCIFKALEDKELMEKEITLQIPRLREVKMEGYLGSAMEIYVVDLLKKNGVVLEKIVAVPAKVEVGEKEISPSPFLL